MFVSFIFLVIDKKIALLGLPKLGENARLRVNITESTQFKNSVDKLMKMANVSLSVGTKSWKEQFTEALTVQSSSDPDGVDDSITEGNVKRRVMPSCGDYILHYISLFWKLLFAIVPPTDMLGGWASFGVSLAFIGLLTVFIGDLATLFGCSVGLRTEVTAISFVALGTSVPDCFASKVAAVSDAYADSSIGNVTGSNAVNVFLGIGLAWLVATIYHAANNSVFRVEPGSLGFSVTIFCVEAVIVIIILLVRRYACGGELGGRKITKYLSGALLFLFWIIYVVLSSLKSYGHIAGF